MSTPPRKWFESITEIYRAPNPINGRQPVSSAKLPNRRPTPGQIIIFRALLPRIQTQLECDKGRDIWATITVAEADDISEDISSV
jgi:hypothetical protein